MSKKKSTRKLTGQAAYHKRMAALEASGSKHTKQAIGIADRATLISEIPFPPSDKQYTSRQVRNGVHAGIALGLLCAGAKKVDHNTILGIWVGLRAAVTKILATEAK